MRGRDELSGYGRYLVTMESKNVHVTFSGKIVFRNKAIVQERRDKSETRHMLTQPL